MLQPSSLQKKLNSTTIMRRPIYTFFLFITVMLYSTINAQSVTTQITQVTPSPLCGDSITIHAIGEVDSLGVSLIEDFESGGLSPVWENYSGTFLFGNDCGPSMNGVNDTHVWVGGGSGTMRYLETAPIDLSSGVTSISFEFRLGSQGSTSFCDGPDNSAEGIYFMYKSPSTGGWTYIHYYDPTDTIGPGAAFYNVPMDQWDTFTFNLPSSALTNATKFRWHQSIFSGAHWDGWGLNNISTDYALTGNYSAQDYVLNLYELDLNNTLQLIQSSPADSITYSFPLYGNKTFLSMYFDSVAGDTIYDTLNVGVQQLANITSSTSTICIGSSVELEASNIGAAYSWSVLPGGDPITTSNFSCDTCMLAFASPDSTTSYVLTLFHDSICYSTDTIKVTVLYDTMQIQGNVTNVNCTGANNGSISISINGGSGPYLINWSNGTNYATWISQLTPGNYSVSVKDNNGCVKSSNYTIAQPLTAITIDSSSVIHTPIDSCYGKFSITASGGTPPYSYNWSNNLTTVSPIIDSLCAGYYTVTVTDSNGCSVVMTTEIIGKNVDTICNSGPNIDYISTSNTLFSYCYGSASVSVVGGIPPYTYSWNDSLNSTSSTIDSLCTGLYSVIVSDSIGCQDSIQVIISDSTPNPPCINGPVIDYVEIVNTLPNDCIGAAQISVSGGTTPYSYIWNDPNNSTTNSVFDLCMDNYQVVVTDSNNCSTNISFNVLDTCAGISMNSILIDEIHSDELSAFHNPFDGDVQLVSQKGGDYTLYIYNVNKELIYDQNLLIIENSTKYVTLPEGLKHNAYLLEVTNEQDEIIIRRMIRQ